MKSIISTLIIILLSCNTLFAQVNIESFRNSATKKGFYGESKANIQFQKGNVNSQVYEIKKDLHYKLNKNHILLKGSASKGFQGKEIYKNNAFVHFRYTIMLHEFLGYEIFTQTQYDEFRDLSLRQLNGAGIRFEKSLQNNNLFQISSGLGIMSDHEQLSYETTTHSRITSYFTLTKYFNENDSSFISVVTYYQPLLFNHDDYRINSEIKLRSSIVNRSEYSLGIDTAITYLYDTVPSEKVKNSDFILKSGIIFSW